MNHPLASMLILFQFNEHLKLSTEHGMFLNTVLAKLHSTKRVEASKTFQIPVAGIIDSFAGNYGKSS